MGFSMGFSMKTHPEVMGVEIDGHWPGHVACKLKIKAQVLMTFDLRQVLLRLFGMVRDW